MGSPTASTATEMQWETIGRGGNRKEYRRSGATTPYFALQDKVDLHLQ